MLRFEVVHHGRDASSSTATREFLAFRSDSAARSYAGRLSKKIDGPVDLARDDKTPWERRYLTTATPSTYHETGYRFERLS